MTPGAKFHNQPPRVLNPLLKKRVLCCLCAVVVLLQLYFVLTTQGVKEDPAPAVLSEVNAGGASAPSHGDNPPQTESPSKISNPGTEAAKQSSAEAMKAKLKALMLKKMQLESKKTP